MKKILCIVLLIFGLGLLLFLFPKNSSNTSSGLYPQSTSVPFPTHGNLQTITLLFVPYWTVASQMEGLSDYNSLLYFGISADKNGIDTHDAGYQKLKQFSQVAPSIQKKYLVVRLINSDLDSEILKNSKLAQKIITQSITIAKQNGFDGIVLDFELPALAFQSVTDSISNFYKTFYAAAKTANMKFIITLYGDTYYRARPYDVSLLSGNSDQVLIMAYDFHKSRGNPGPNFPLNGNEQYGYDFSHMIEDFSKDVPKEKLGVVFGLFGYDWHVDVKKESVANGEPLSFLEIKQKFLDNCESISCQIISDQTSTETKIEYKDGSDTHIVWFEDPLSVQKKIKFLKKQGISSFGYWAYTYF